MNAIRAMKQALAEAARLYPDATAMELAEEAQDIFREWMEEEAAFRETIEDTPCLESCDQWGTGEGRWHGVIR